MPTLPRSASTSTSKKRKVEEDPDTEDEQQVGASSKPAKKSRTTAAASESAVTQAAAAKAKPKGKGKGKGEAVIGIGGEDVFAPNGQPTNKVLPVRMTFPPKVAGTVRIASWNVCGLAASQKKGFKHYVEAEDPDIIFLSETKINNEPVDPSLTTRFPYRYWSIGEKKGHSGSAFLSKHEPIGVNMTLPGHPNQNYVKGRIITLEYATCWLVGTYVVNAGEKLKNMAEKEEWNVHFERYIRQLDATKPVIWFGDLNVAPTALDIKNDKTNWNKTPGYTQIECDGFARILNGTEVSTATPDGQPPPHNKFFDVWRDRHPTDEHYTYWSYRFNCRVKGIGWRLDMFVVSERLVSQVQTCEIRSTVYGASDHVPIVLEVEGPL